MSAKSSRFAEEPSLQRQVEAEKRALKDQRAKNILLAKKKAAAESMTRKKAHTYQISPKPVGATKPN